MGKTVTPLRRQLYEDEFAARSKEFSSLADTHLSGSSSLALYRAAMEQSLREYYIRLAIIAKGGRALTARDRSDLGKFLASTYDYLHGFTKALSSRKAVLSDAQVLARSSSYANAWGVFTRFALPAALADALPALPGFDCLGGFRCGCWLEWAAGEKTVEVYWHVNPIKEHCVLCVDYDAEWSPLILDLADLDQELLSEEEDFFDS